ncbi:MAG: DNA mismatch repair protein MutS [Bacteroidota bacterium]
MAKINQQEIKALNHEFDQYADGAEFLDPLHPNAIDLDLFGPYSFFQYSNRTSTVLGAKALAEYLSNSTDQETIINRQEAILELQSELDWRQHFLAYGRRTEDSQRQIDLLHQWVDQAYFILPNSRLKNIIRILPFLTTLGFGYLLSLQLFGPSLLALVPAFLVLRKYVLRINTVHQQTTHAEKALNHYGQLIQHIEQQPFQSALLQNTQANFEPQASQAIRELSYIISQLNARYNAFVLLFNIFGLWDLQWVWRLEKWKEKYKTPLPHWFEALGQFEVLSSLATVGYNNPDWTFPEITAEGAITAQQLGHPLLHQDKRIANDVALPTQGHIKLLTGSNMAGKSTFLRTVGLNIVLAMCGAPICAREMKLPLLQVYSSMRTQDALQESTSSFYAELKRLKVIIEAVEQEDNIFFLLDEILKGTNSKDRHTGSKALIKQLIQQGGGGVIATHDLELGILESQYGGAIENWCMEVQIENGQLHFDYLLKKGVSQSFNATLLMQNMGIKIDQSIDSL